MKPNLMDRMALDKYEQITIGYDRRLSLRHWIEVVPHNVLRKALRKVAEDEDCRGSSEEPEWEILEAMLAEARAASVIAEA